MDIDIDIDLAQALGRLGQLRRTLNRSIAQQTIGVPVYGAREALQWIDKLERPNVTQLAEAMSITRGGVSKSVAKLQRLGLIERYQLPENRKEIFFRLTDEGAQRLAQLRQSLDALTAQELAFLETLSLEQKQVALDFINRYVAYMQAGNVSVEAEKETHT